MINTGKSKLAFCGECSIVCLLTLTGMLICIIPKYTHIMYTNDEFSLHDKDWKDIPSLEFADLLKSSSLIDKSRSITSWQYSFPKFLKLATKREVQFHLSLQSAIKHVHVQSKSVSYIFTHTCNVSIFGRKLQPYRYRILMIIFIVLVQVHVSVKHPYFVLSLFLTVNRPI